MAPSLFGAGFRYQGQLKTNGAPANDSFNLVFRSYDAPSGGIPLGTISRLLPITSGLFTGLLDLGSPFNGDEFWLGISVSADLSETAQRWTNQREVHA